MTRVLQTTVGNPRLLGAVSVCALLAGAPCIGAAANQVAGSSTQPAPPPGDASKGRRLYRSAGCYQCHSDQAQGGAQGPRLGPNPIPFRNFLAYSRAPRGEMPPYTAKVMSDQDFADIYAFLRALPTPPPLSAIPLLRR